MRSGPLAAAFFLAGALVLALAPDTPTQADPLAAQQSAVARIDAVIDTFRKTGEIRTAELAQAERELAPSNAALAERGDWAAAANGLIKQGHTLRMRGQWEAALPLYEQASRAASQAGHLTHEADSWAWAARAETSRNNFGSALAAAQQAVRLAERSGDADVLARALDALAIAQIARRDLAGAAATAERGLAVARDAKDPMARYYALFTRGDVYSTTGARCESASECAACMKALDLARADLGEAAALVRGLGFVGLASVVDGVMQGVEERRALLRRDPCASVMEGFAAAFRPKKASDVLVHESFVPPRMEAPPGLAQLYQQALRTQREAGPYADTMEAVHRHTMGLMSQMNGDNDAALDHFSAAVALLERDRRALRDDLGRASVLDDRIGIYHAALLELLQRRRHAEAFAVLERSRSRAMADLLAARELSVGRAGEQRLYAQWVGARSAIAAAQVELFERSAGGDAGAKVQALRERVRALEADERKLQERIAAEAPRLQTLAPTEPVALAELQRSMREERYEMLQYLALDTGLIVWHITSAGVTVKHVFLPRVHLRAKAEQLRESLATPGAEFDDTLARELYLFLVAPVIDKVRAERLVIVAHDAVGAVPFQALRDPADGRFLGERLQLSYAPSASVLLGMRRSESIAGARVLGLGNPKLPGMPEELNALRALRAPARIIDDALPKKRELAAWVGDAEVVHLAVHGKFDDVEPLRSHLEFAPDGADDGLLTAAEMFALPLAASRLVVLSACESGRAATTPAGEAVGIVRALIYAGAGTLVLSSWKVDSEAASAWMQAFYAAALKHPLPEAARRALVAVKAMPAFAHPRHWAAFSVVGR